MTNPVIPEKAIDEAWDKLHENSPRPTGITYSMVEAALEAAGCAVIPATPVEAAHLGDSEVPYSAIAEASITLSDDAYRLIGWAGVERLLKAAMPHMQPGK